MKIKLLDFQDLIQFIELGKSFHYLILINAIDD